MQFKPDFVKKYQNYFDLNILSKPIKKAIRINTLKISVNDFKKLDLFNLEQVPWCKEGFWTDEINLGRFKEHEKGLYFVQSAVSMIPSLVLNPTEKDTVLDMCASPGAKSTHLASLMNNKGKLYCNDINALKVNTLRQNLDRCSVKNYILTQKLGWNLTGDYDKILLDAPCSGSGIISKNPEAMKVWNKSTGKRFSKNQKRLLAKAMELGKEIVYSTCSLEQEENEKVIEWALKNFNIKLEEIKLPGLKKSEVLSENNEVKKCLRIWPSEKNEGFFVAKIKKL